MSPSLQKLLILQSASLSITLSCYTVGAQNVCYIDERMNVSYSYKNLVKISKTSITISIWQMSKWRVGELVTWHSL